MKGISDEIGFNSVHGNYKIGNQVWHQVNYYDVWCIIRYRIMCQVEKQIDEVKRRISNQTWRQINDKS